MTHSRHIIVSMLAFLALGLVATAQSTSTRPYEGATHTYSCNGISSGVDYEFFIASDVEGYFIYDDATTGEFDFLTSPTGSLAAGQSVASVDIRWNNGASLHIYQLYLEVTIPGGCSNRIRLEITPQVNGFDLLSENVPVTNTRSCPSTSDTDGFNALASEYDAGFTTLQFLVRRENGSRDWSFVPSLTVNPDLSLGKFIISVTGNNTGVITPDFDNRYMVYGSDNEVLVTVTIENAPGYTRDVMLQLTGQREEQTNLPDGNPANDKVTHTIEVIPLIGGMGGV